MMLWHALWCFVVRVHVNCCVWVNYYGWVWLVCIFTAVSSGAKFFVVLWFSARLPYFARTVYFLVSISLSLNYLNLYMHVRDITKGSLKVIKLSDSICSRLLSWFGSLIIKNIPNRTISSCTTFGYCNEDHIYRHYMATFMYHSPHSALGRAHDFLTKRSSPGWCLFSFSSYFSLFTFKCSFILLWTFLWPYLKM
jgi:hypothetical protein